MLLLLFFLINIPGSFSSISATGSCNNNKYFESFATVNTIGVINCINLRTSSCSRLVTLIPFTCNIRSPSLRPAKLAWESVWILLIKCTCDVISAWGINELKSSPTASGIVI